MDEPLIEIHEMVDSELMGKLKQHGGFQREIALALKYRRLFKRVFTLTKGKASDSEKKVIKSLREPKKRMKMEEEICKKARIPIGNVIIDVPERELEISEPRIRATNVKILDGSKLSGLSRYSPLARALEIRDVYDWEIMVSSPAKHEKKVKKVVKKVLFS
jgi:hypothetical protein